MPAYSIWSFGALLLVERAAFVHTRGTVPRGVAGSGRIGGRRDSRPWQEQDYTGTASARWDGGRLPAGIAAAAVDFAGVFLRAATRRPPAPELEPAPTLTSSTSAVSPSTPLSTPPPPLPQSTPGHGAAGAGAHAALLHPPPSAPAPWTTGARAHADLLYLRAARPTLSPSPYPSTSNRAPHCGGRQRARAGLEWGGNTFGEPSQPQQYPRRRCRHQPTPPPPPRRRPHRRESAFLLRYLPGTHAYPHLGRLLQEPAGLRLPGVKSRPPGLAPDPKGLLSMDPGEPSRLLEFLRELRCRKGVKEHVLAHGELRAAVAAWRRVELLHARAHPSRRPAGDGWVEGKKGRRKKMDG
ncbi:hypothetical protein SETIT_9G443700v2 [Setaria italica]|uniref:Uncharacterized protein n=1 Tax=Setaria italica TaxID=4555 RepID=A0A368SSC4_SETIT|nr:hypothetical protein SETIT_9G443700v2 [Setaria italica]